MRILVTGPESSGTKMVAALLRQAGAKIVHSSPNYRYYSGEPAHRSEGFDAVVLVMRDGYANVNSMIENGHAQAPGAARMMIVRGLLWILSNLREWEKVHVTTYEALTTRPGALAALCRELGLPEEFEHDEIGDGNAKYYGGAFFRDDRELHDRA